MLFQINTIHLIRCDPTMLRRPDFVGRRTKCGARGTVGLGEAPLALATYRAPTLARSALVGAVWSAPSALGATRR
jgi:hypothetical protein